MVEGEILQWVVLRSKESPSLEVFNQRLGDCLLGTLWRGKWSGIRKLVRFHPIGKLHWSKLCEKTDISGIRIYWIFNDTKLIRAGTYARLEPSVLFSLAKPSFSSVATSEKLVLNLFFNLKLQARFSGLTLCPLLRVLPSAFAERQIKFQDWGIMIAADMKIPWRISKDY